MKLIQNAILKSGPVQATFYVFEDFPDYTSGVYRRTSTEYDGIHTVRLLGWGVDSAEGPYWIAANEWSTQWGEEGTFRITRGTNDCGFEDAILYGEYAH